MNYEIIIQVLFFIIAVFGGYFPVKWGMLSFMDDSMPVGFPAAGARIGLLERSLFWICLVLDQGRLIGFILTIKAIYRFGDIHGNNTEKMRLSEYFIIGTMYSLLWTLIVWLMAIRCL